MKNFESLYFRGSLLHRTDKLRLIVIKKFKLSGQVDYTVLKFIWYY